MSKASDFRHRILRRGPLAAGFAIALLLLPSPPRAQSGPADVALEKTGAVPVTEADPAAALRLRRESTRRELDALSGTIRLTDEKTRELVSRIGDLEKDRASLREAIVASAKARKDMEQRILDGERRLTALRGEESGIRASLIERRGLLAEVLAALQRMGRNPPPALLVTPDDALSSVRSAILLGAVVPGLRAETDKLVADLAALSDVQARIGAERSELASAMESRLAEEKRSELLIRENEAMSAASTRTLEAERRRAEELAGRATGLQALIGSLEREISSVRDAAALAKAEEERLAKLSAEERQRQKQQALEAMPDKNRIAPAYPFSDLTGRLDYPVAGEPLRQFGDADGTGHQSQGLVLAANPGALVTAPADGWIVFAGNFRSYGRMVILNAGEDFHLVLSGMDQVTVREGQFVVAGEPLATMGNKRVASVNALALETDRPTLYIEFRKNGKPVDSGPWWTSKVSGKARNDT
ncbi:murein hydrolase activator EnvC [Rhizobium sp. TRM95111]|uniref:murein hydrolase activator EnvC family protein n=1 Tax=Rhizobium alarense TaxID=2846851 RepID=UPI001F27A1A9|nr:murein hydrolase activator EnvC [Rhizobium alarense]MCF3641352.1 murein hydrolase activator EnvC [Rhizobium alarense]